MNTVKQAMKQADALTQGYIRRNRISEWDLAHEPAAQNEVDAFWQDAFREAKEDLLAAQEAE